MMNYLCKCMVKLVFHANCSYIFSVRTVGCVADMLFTANFVRKVDVFVKEKICRAHTQNWE